MRVSPINVIRVPIAVFLFSILIVFSVGSVRAEEEALTKTVEVVGTGRIKGEGLSTARGRSISNSLVSAVARVTADLLSLDARVRNFEVLNETLYSRTNEFVRDYKVLTSSASGDEYRVIVQVTVLMDRIEQALSNVGIQSGKRGMPRVLFFVTELRLDDVLSAYRMDEDSINTASFSETAMSETLRAKAFTVIDPGNLFRTAQTEFKTQDIESVNRAAVNFGFQLQADVVIVGQSMAYRTQNILGENIRSFKGVVNVRGFRTNTGEEIAATAQTAIVTGTDEIIGTREALTRAGSLAGAALVSQITAAWRKADAQSDIVEIIVEGTGNLSDFVKFRTIISEMSGVKGIQMKEIKPDEATMIVNFYGNAKDLADALMLKNFESIGINIYEVSQSRLRVELKP
ncbi:MAG: hypothetical protein JRF27_03250 [Deltaproteobacteria bacterium]|nr:hypothetical protein [Deltaproteobacteria bacterium]